MCRGEAIKSNIRMASLSHVSFRCRNSINILTRQEKAAKLSTCLCDGSEEYDCKGIHRNMNTLCFGRIHHDYRQVKKVVDETRTNEIVRTETNDVLGNEATNEATTVRPFVDRTTLAMSIVLLLLFASQGNPHLFYNQLVFIARLASRILCATGSFRLLLNSDEKNVMRTLNERRTMIG